MTNIIKVKFLRGGQPSGRDYTYYTPVEVAVGDTVELESRESIAKGIVTEINIPEEEIVSYKDKIKSILGKYEEPKQEAGPTFIAMGVDEKLLGKDEGSISNLKTMTPVEVDIVLNGIWDKKEQEELPINATEGGTEHE